eukprot:scaffold34815_cov63-Phaeocystis_antarctica.AAC.3
MLSNTLSLASRCWVPQPRHRGSWCKALCSCVLLTYLLTGQHAVVLDVFEVETEDEHQRHRAEVGGEDEAPAQAPSHHDRHSGQRRLGRAVKRRGAVVPPLPHERDPHAALRLERRA